MIEAVPHWAAASCYDETQRLVLAYTDCLVLDRGRVPDGLFAALHAQLGDEEILELTYIAALYLQHAVMSRALRTEFDDRPEPVVEVLDRGRRRRATWASTSACPRRERPRRGRPVPGGGARRGVSP